jgi:hypothetical protein
MIVLYYWRIAKMKNNFFVLIVCLGIFISCDSLFKTTITVDFDYNKMNSEKGLWDRSKPHNYQYVFSNIENGPGFYTPIKTLIIIEDGEYKRQDAFEEYSEADVYFQTIDNIYETIERRYREYNNTEQSKKDEYLTKIRIEYDENNHIPIRIDFYYYVPKGIADAPEHWMYTIKDFKING